ncbi:calcium-translocating P-type ATPase, SERCA-type [Pseudovibrio japonicus]|uniref:Calcium-translocating P-type ATPase, SERCA-type n=1 Tax=Pseudovibrio japonicus TaxID=366534 RepID=A0ABQ3EJW1_9HYPH|nr:cation-translocating P-type ATPase [Pseudovibrio japonicus]GHB43231.1 calcium-translocating P-type ATPase, SERCA-type [Pseudovibrio japonicus]
MKQRTEYQSPPYLLSIHAVLASQKVDPEHGLPHEVVKQRQAQFGANSLKQDDTTSVLSLLLSQTKNPLLIILLIGSIISAYTGHWVDAIAIFLIVVINASITFFQEWRAEQTLAALSKMAAPKAVVLRDGKASNILAEDLVPGDIVKLKAGDIIPADLRLIENSQLQVDESALTGESEAVFKTTDEIPHEPVLAERFNMGFMSTHVTNGTGVGVVTATGMETEVGQIAHLISQAKLAKTPLQLRMESLSRILISVALLVVAAVIGIGLLNGMQTFDILTMGISLSVAAIPEGLPTVITIVLTLGSRKMAENNALTKRLASVETLGTVSVICSDKTGTLTKNKMKAMSLWAAGNYWSFADAEGDDAGAIVDSSNTPARITEEPDLRDMLEMSAYCNDAVLTDTASGSTVMGSPTEGALLIAAATAGIYKQDLEGHSFKTISHHPFNSTRKLMSIHAALPDGRECLVVKGAPDVILARSKFLRQDGKDIPLDEDASKEVEQVISGYGEQALRTLAVAYRKLDASGFDPEDPEQDLVLIGIHGIMDPPRREVTQALAEARGAGIRTIMITGDHAATATSIAERIGLKTSPTQTVHTGAELDRLSDQELQQVVKHAVVFARVTPKHKLRIVSALQENDEIAAMTGDGVNDAPALRKSDIGVAMGISGTAVAKASASLILLDDNYATIVKAVREGRRIYDNQRKFIRQELTANVAEVSAILFAFTLMGSDAMLPLTPLMILWVNLVSDGMPALSLGLEPADSNLMERPPRARSENIFGDGMQQRIVLRGLAIGFVSFAMFAIALNRGLSLPYAQTLAFSTLIFGQLWHIFDSRANWTLFSKYPFSNSVLLVAVVLSATLSLLAIYSPPGNYVLGTVPVALNHLFETFFIAALPTLALSGIKEVFKFRFL